MTLKLLSYNIRFGGAGREDQLARVIRESERDPAIRLASSAGWRSLITNGIPSVDRDGRSWRSFWRAPRFESSDCISLPYIQTGPSDGGSENCALYLRASNNT